MSHTSENPLPIRSGTTTERIVRSSILVAMVVGFCLWSYYDRFVRYPRQNVEAVAQNYPDLLNRLPEPDPAVTQKLADSLAERKQWDDVVDLLGPPDYEGERSVGTSPPDTGAAAPIAVYFGEVGAIEIARSRSNSQIQGVRWIPGGKHSRVDLNSQLVIAVILTPLSLWALMYWIRVLTTRLELTEEGLRQGRRAVVTWDTMTGFDSRQYPKKGWIDLQYDLDGQDGRVRLDDYVHKEFASVISAICERKGYSNPLTKRSEPASTVPAPSSPSAIEKDAEG